MKFSELRNKKWFRIISNRYILILIVFAVWMIFFDANSYLIHRELDQEINNLKSNAEFYQTEIEKDETFMKNLEDEEEMERFAREKYYLKRENEDIYIIEHEDSLRKVDAHE